MALKDTIGRVLRWAVNTGQAKVCHDCPLAPTPRSALMAFCRSPLEKTNVRSRPDICKDGVLLN